MNRNSSLCNAIFCLEFNVSEITLFLHILRRFQCHSLINCFFNFINLSYIVIALYSQCSKFLYELSYRNNLIHVYLFAHQTCTIDTSSIPFDSPSTPTPPHPHYVLVPDSYLTTQHKIQRNVH